jgi:integrase
MAGSYRKLKNGKWELCVNLGTDLKGKRIRKTKNVVAKNKTEVEKLLAEFVTKCSKANYNNSGNLTLREFYELWLKDYAEQSLRKKTLSRYKSLWTRIDYCLGHFKINEIRPPHLIEFYKMLKENGVRKDNQPGGLSPITIKHHHGLISIILETAFSWEIINSNPCTKIKLSKLGISSKESRKKIEEMIYSIDETKKLIEELNDEHIKYKTLIYLALFTGCRREEILGIEWQDINFETGEIDIIRSSQYTAENGIFEDDLKTATSRRSCFVPKQVLELLNEYKDYWIGEKNNVTDEWLDTDRLFIQKTGKPMHPDTVGDWFRKFLKRKNLPHTRFHNLRHLHISILLLMGMDINSIADQAGHSDLQMIVKRYSHNLKKKMAETADYMSKALFEKND